MNSNMILIIAVFAFMLLIVLLKSPVRKGVIGENVVANLIRECYEDGVVLQNLYIPTSDGNTTEIDLVWITKKGIYVIECKNRKGWIFGNEKSKYWMQIIYNRRHQLFNPVLQNRVHVNSLRQLLGKNVKLFSIIVFVGNCVLKDITIESRGVYVIHKNEFQQTIDFLRYNNRDVIDDNMINDLNTKLTGYLKQNTDKDVIIKHDEYVKNKKVS